MGNNKVTTHKLQNADKFFATTNLEGRGCWAVKQEYYNQLD